METILNVLPIVSAITDPIAVAYCERDNSCHNGYSCDTERNSRNSGA